MRKPDMDHLQYIELLLVAKANPNQHMQTHTVSTNRCLFEESATPFSAKLNGLVRVGVQPAIGHLDTSKLLSTLMVARNPPVPPEARILASTCITDLGK